LLGAGFDRISRIGVLGAGSHIKLNSPFCLATNFNSSVISPSDLDCAVTTLHRGHLALFPGDVQLSGLTCGRGIPHTPEALYLLSIAVVRTRATGSSSVPT
jgi:hypothetical protein